MSKNKKRKLLQFFFTLSTIVALAQINYTIFHSPYIIVFALMLLVHEFGHYFVSRLYGADPDLPYFIPLPLISIGITRIRNLDPKYISQVSMAGMLYSSMFLILLIMFNLITPFFSTLYLFSMLLLELLFNITGSDGKRYRKYKYQS